MIRTSTIPLLTFGIAVLGFMLGAGNAMAASECCEAGANATTAQESHDHIHGEDCDHAHAHHGQAPHEHAGGACANCADSSAKASAAAMEMPAAPAEWSAEIVHRFSSLPVQDGGRVKPLGTMARFALLQMSGRTTVVNPEGRKLSATEWLLDCLFHPRYAEHTKVFLIHSPEVMDTLGIEHEEMRDRFSYAQLMPARTTLFTLAQQAAHMEKEDRTRVQEQLMHLAHNVHEYEMLTHYLEFARREFPIGASTTLAAVFDGAESVSYSEALARGPEIIDALIALRESQGGAHGHAGRDAEMDHAAAFFQGLERASESAHSLAFFPPGGPADMETEWYAPGDLLVHLLQPPADHAARTQLLGELEALEQTKDSPAAFAAHLDNLHDGVVAMAIERGEHRGIALEVTYYRLNLLQYGLALYVFAFILAALAWMRPHSRLLWWAAMVVASVPLALHIGAITIRCIIRLRPPVTTLYETLLFTAAVAVFCALVMEFINRRRIGLGMAGFLGALGLFLANRFEVQEGVDTMPSLIAVLDTNFWLSIHVITMVMGYAGGMLAAAIAHVYLLGKTFGIKRDNKDFYKSLARMTYGAICFGLLFSTVGTVLGGLWAADSWGRFWGWDPKENGALIVVLWGLIVLHARMGGYIRDYGVQMAAIFGGITVAFAWFGVNLLGVGLHSYGFTDGVHGALMSFYALESGVLLLSALGWFRMQGLLRLPRRAARVDEAVALPPGQQQET